MSAAANNNNVVMTENEFIAYMQSHPGTNFMTLYPPNVFVKAIMSGDKAKVAKMIAKGVNVNTYAMIKDLPYTESLPIFAAIKKGDMDIVMMLLDAGVDVNVTKGATFPLELAIGYGHTDMVKFLLDKGAKPQNVARGFHVLTYAVSKGNPEVVKELLRPGLVMEEEHQHMNGTPYMASIPLIEKTDSEGRTPLIAAAEFNKPEIVKLLLEHGANLNGESRSGNTPVWIAFIWRLDSILKILVESGVDINTVMTEGKSLLQFAQEGRFDPPTNKAILDIAEKARRKLIVEGEVMRNIMVNKGVPERLANISKRYLRKNTTVRSNNNEFFNRRAEAGRTVAGVGSGSSRRWRRSRRRSYRSKH